MPDPVVYLQAMGVAAGASAIVVLALGGNRKPAGTTRANAACVLAIALGVVLGCVVMRLRLQWPPANGLDRLFFVVFPAVIGVELVAGLARVSRRVAWMLRLALSAATGRILLHASAYLEGPGREWSALQAGVTLSLCAVLLAGVWVLLAWLSRRSPGVSLPLVLSQATLVCGIAIMLAGYIAGGAAAWPLVAALAGTSVAARLVARPLASEGAIGIGVVGLFGLLFIGRFFGALTTERALVLFLAPLLCWVTELPMLRYRSPWIVGAVRMALVAIPLGAVLVLARNDFNRKMRPLLGAKSSTTLRGVNDDAKRVSFSPDEKSGG